LDIECESEGLLIGRHGQTLSSLQYLVNRVIHNSVNKQVRYIIDVGGYKVRHKAILEKMAKRIAQKVSDSKEEEELAAMSAYDRRIIHMYIKDNSEVTTYSLGEGNYRRVVIAPKDKAVPSEQ
jgi:spoIIIJ-associated protein